MTLTWVQDGLLGAIVATHVIIAARDKNNLLRCVYGKFSPLDFSTVSEWRMVKWSVLELSLILLPF
jgi:hypothetical protein